MNQQATANTILLSVSIIIKVYKDSGANYAANKFYCPVTFSK